MARWLTRDDSVIVSKGPKFEVHDEDLQRVKTVSSTLGSITHFGEHVYYMTLSEFEEPTVENCIDTLSCSIEDMEHHIKHGWYPTNYTSQMVTQSIEMRRDCPFFLANWQWWARCAGNDKGFPYCAELVRKATAN